MATGDRQGSQEARAQRTKAAAQGQPATLEAERGIPPVSGRSGRSRGSVIALGTGIVVLLLLMWLVNPPQPNKSTEDPYAADQRFDERKGVGVEIAPPIPSAPPLLAQARPFEPPQPPVPVPVPNTDIQIVPGIDPTQHPAGTRAPAAGQREKTPFERRMSSPTVIYDAHSSGSASTPGAPRSRSPEPVPGLQGLNADGTLAPAPQAGGAPMPRVMPTAYGVPGTGPMAEGSQEHPAPRSAEDEGSLDQVLRPTKLQGARAIRMGDRRLMLASGKLIDCTLDTAISSVVAGMTKCTLTRDVYGEDGSVVLLDRGTELIGEYRSNLRPGQTRLGIVWSRAKTPRGVLIDLASPASDALGRAGVEGHVETHFWARYGAAILLSTIDDVAALAVERARENGVYYPPQTMRTGRDAAAVALEHNIRIAPTIVKNQGEHITVFVARDLDFRPVYGYRGPPAAPGAV